MGRLQFAAADVEDAFVGGEDRVEQKIGLDQPRRGEDRLVDRVAVKDPGSGQGVLAADLWRVEDLEVGGHAGLPGRHPRHQPLAPAAETGEVVETAGAGDHHPVGLDHAAIDRHRQAGLRSAEGDQLPGVVRLVVADRDPSEQGAENLAVLGFGLPAVDAEGDDDVDGLVLDPGGIEAFHQKRQVMLAAGVAGDVGGDDGHLLAGAHQLLQARTAEGGVERGLYQVLRIRRRSGDGRDQQGGSGQGTGPALLAVFQIMVRQTSPPGSTSP